MTDQAIVAEIGNRIKGFRLRKNLTQQEVAEATALSLNTIKALESGKGKIASLIAVLRELGALDALDSFIPEVSISPLQLARRHGKKRRRASGKRIKDKDPGDGPKGYEPW
ncbi:MAG: helix-turn-helix transcriptional regulator [Planctomycetota bacterium]